MKTPFEEAREFKETKETINEMILKGQADVIMQMFVILLLGLMISFIFIGEQFAEIKQLEKQQYTCTECGKKGDK